MLGTQGWPLPEGTGHRVRAGDTRYEPALQPLVTSLVLHVFLDTSCNRPPGNLSPFGQLSYTKEGWTVCQERPLAAHGPGGGTRYPESSRFLQAVLGHSFQLQR